MKETINNLKRVIPFLRKVLSGKSFTSNHYEEVAQIVHKVITVYKSGNLSTIIPWIEAPDYPPTRPLQCLIKTRLGIITIADYDIKSNNFYDDDGDYIEEVEYWYPLYSHAEGHKGF